MYKKIMLCALCLSGCVVPRYDSSDYQQYGYQTSNTSASATAISQSQRISQNSTVNNVYHNTYLQNQYKIHQQQAQAKKFAYENARNKAERARLKREWEMQKISLERERKELERQRIENQRRETEARRAAEEQQHLAQQRLAAEQRYQQLVNRQCSEQAQRDMQRATQESMRTAQAEAAKREQLCIQEERDMQQAIANSMQTYNQEQTSAVCPPAPTPAPAASVPAPAPEPAEPARWEPNSGHMYDAGRHSMDLQRELRRTPSQSEIKARLQTKMPTLTSEQINIIMEYMF